MAEPCRMARRVVQAWSMLGKTPWRMVSGDGTRGGDGVACATIFGACLQRSWPEQKLLGHRLDAEGGPRRGDVETCMRTQKTISELPTSS
jgi:hypothetical protein